MVRGQSHELAVGCDELTGVGDIGDADSDARRVDLSDAGIVQGGCQEAGFEIGCGECGGGKAFEEMQTQHSGAAAGIKDLHVIAGLQIDAAEKPMNTAFVPQ